MERTVADRMYGAGLLIQRRSIYMYEIYTRDDVKM